MSQGLTVANVKAGQLTPPPEWWRHLRGAKRTFWKRERRAAKVESQQRVGEA